MNLDDTRSLIQKMQTSGEFTQIQENPLRTYYTCVRYRSKIVDSSIPTGQFGTVYYGPAEWSCTKGWFETYDNTYRGKSIDSKVLNYCKFRNTEEALKKDMNDDLTLFIPNVK